MEKRFVIKGHSDKIGTYYFGYEGRAIFFDVLRAELFKTKEEAIKEICAAEHDWYEVIELNLSIEIVGTVARIEPDPEYE